jgi:restriction system protein
MSTQTEDWDELTGEKLTLDEWLHRVFASESSAETHIVDHHFPTNDHADEYLASIGSRSERDVVRLLRHFLFVAGSFGLHDASLVAWIKHLRAHPPDENDGPIRIVPFEELIEMEHPRRVLLNVATDGRVPSWDGNRWVLDLLPHYPRSAIEALDAYFLAHAQHLPDGRLHGLSDAISVIRAKFIQAIPGDAREALRALTPREFEHVTERLYSAMGYKTVLTKQTRDGGRDIIATKHEPGVSETVLVECKLYDKTEVGYEQVMKLLGVVSNERASRGAIVTTGHVTRDAASATPRIEIMGFERLCQVMNEHWGPKWPHRLDRLILESQSAASERTNEANMGTKDAG